MLVCADFGPTEGIANATKIYLFNSTAQNNVGVARVCLYTGGGTNLLVDSGAIVCPQFTKCGNTGLSAFSLAVGTEYRLCTTSDNASLAYIAGSLTLSVVTNAFVNHVGTAANVSGSTAASCPATTGTLSAISDAFPQVYLSVE
jgi:hypothetical protein